MEKEVVDIRDLYNELIQCADRYKGALISQEMLSLLYRELLNISTRWKERNRHKHIQVDGKDVYIDTLVVDRPTYDTGGVILIHLLVNEYEYVPKYDEPTDVDTHDEDTDSGKSSDVLSDDPITNEFLNSTREYFAKKYVGKVMTADNKRAISEDMKLIFNIQGYTNAKCKVLEARIDALEEELNVIKNLISDRKE